MAWWDDLANYVPLFIADAWEKLSLSDRQGVTQLQLRIGAVPKALIWGRCRYLGNRILTREDLLHCTSCILDHSPAVHLRERSQGFVTLPGGYRVGLCGRTGMEAGECRVQEITSLCIRIRRSLEGSSLTWLRWLWKNHGTLRSCLLLSPPGLGKTTLLSDAALQLARGFDGYPPLNVGVVDERGEFRTDAHLACCDVLSGTDKPRGILWLLRSMSPQVIVVDEIGSMEDAAALADAARSGVVLLASAHAQDFSALSSRAVLEPLRAYFPCRVLLGKSPGQIVGFEEEP